MTVAPSSPLRYPGGKQVLTRVLATLIKLNQREGCVYAEAHAGGCGAGLSLLFSERVSRLLINDADRSIYAFWHSVLTQTGPFLRMLQNVSLSVEEWRRQRDIYVNADRYSLLRVGFATFYLNRCNRSGIVANGGLIGGLEQKGKWKLDARFNKDGLRQRIERIGLYRGRIEATNLDALEFLHIRTTRESVSCRHFVYLDPPYFVKGRQLYLDYYSPADHAALARYLTADAKFLWALSYDNVRPIHSLYRGYRKYAFNLSYSARGRRLGRELMVVDPKLRVPSDWKGRIPSTYLGAAHPAPGRR